MPDEAWRKIILWMGKYFLFMCIYSKMFDHNEYLIK